VAVAERWPLWRGRGRMTPVFFFIIIVIIILRFFGGGGCNIFGRCQEVILLVGASFSGHCRCGEMSVV